MWGTTNGIGQFACKTPLWMLRLEVGAASRLPGRTRNCKTLMWTPSDVHFCTERCELTPPPHPHPPQYCTCCGGLRKWGTPNIKPQIIGSPFCYKDPKKVPLTSETAIWQGWSQPTEPTAAVRPDTPSSRAGTKDAIQQGSLARVGAPSFQPLSFRDGGLRYGGYPYSGPSCKGILLVEGLD